MHLHPEIRLKREPWAAVFFRRDRILDGDVSFVHPRLIYLVLSQLAGELDRAADQIDMDRSEARDHVNRFRERHPTGFAGDNGAVVTAEDAARWLYEPEPLPLARRLSWPVGLNIMVTDECCFHCRYCCITVSKPGRGTVLPTDRFREIVAQSAPRGTESVYLHGGEPLLHPDLVELIQCCTDHDMFVSFSTKASIAPELARRLAGAGLTKAQVSIDSPDPDREHKLTGSHLRGLMSTVQHLAAQGVAVTVNTIVSRSTLDEFEELATLCAGLGASMQSLSLYSYSLINSRPEYLLTSEELDRLDEIVASFDCPGFAVQYSRPSVLDKLGPGTGCGSMRVSANISPAGELVLCDKLAHEHKYSVGPDLIAGWTSQAADAFVVPQRHRFQGTACEDCNLFDQCQSRGRCMYRSLVLHGREYAPDLAIAQCESGGATGEPDQDQRN